MPNKDGTLKAREFVFFCEDQVLAALPPDLPAPERKVMWTILQFHFGQPGAHFELQPQMARGLVEAGLHFEGPVEANDAWVEVLAAHAADILGELGPAWELEEWTPSWRRLHRPYRFGRLTADLGREIAAELARAIRVLQPILAGTPASAIPAVTPARRGPPARMRHRARRR